MEATGAAERKNMKRLELLRSKAGHSVVHNIPVSPSKMRVVANMVRGKNVDEAIAMLAHLPKRSARIFSKAVKSAVANADDRSGGKVDVDELYLSVVEVDGGPIIKRWLPRAMGRANRINHRTSHLTVAVDEA